MSEYLVGLTSYRVKVKENIVKGVSRYVKLNKHFEASQRINTYVRDSIDWSTVNEYRGYAALGIYEGLKEPSVMVSFTSKAPIPKIKSQLKAFKIRTHQDSILLGKVIKSSPKANPMIEITIKNIKDLSKTQKLIGDISDGKLGGCLTYIYALHRIVIIHVPEFDGLSVKEFKHEILKIQKVLKSKVSGIRIRYVKTEVI